MASVGNFKFVEGDWDDWEYEKHWLEDKACRECDCYCTERTPTEIRKCVPKTLYLTITALTNCDGLDGTYEMKQCRVLTYDHTTGVDNQQPWPTKFQWVSDPVACPNGGSEHVLQFVLECVSALYDESLEYPAFRLWLARYGAGGVPYSCSTITFDPDDPFTGLVDTGITPTSPATMAFAKDTSSCEPFYLEFPILIEDQFQCNDSETIACCGGYINSGDPPDESDPSSFEVTISE